MPRIIWPDLEAVYAVTTFDADDKGRVTIATEQVLKTLLLVDQDSDAAADAGMELLSESDELALGRTVQVQLNAPRHSLGRLAKTFSNLIAGPKARVEEPQNYFIIKDRVTAETQPPVELQVRYRAALSLVALLAKAAAFLDGVQQELVFFRDGRIAISVDYDVSDLEILKPTDVQALIALFEDPIHLEQKLTILSEAVIDAVAGLPSPQRFRHVIREVKDISEKVSAGYRLFASSFTYSKIRREVESAQAEFIARMHKTFVDLQGQILGIPIATIVVASQLKAAKDCGVELWTDTAVVAGAWIFVVFLIASIVNQWLTLNAISFEFERQQERLKTDFAGVTSNFNDAFTQLKNRASWHRLVFVVIGSVGVGGAIFATWIAGKLITVDVQTCF
ncbi:hypothetical protein FJW04_19090 [Mesorhizobium sp. B2-7-3]|uniref:hypothetical protein n=1 Tax=Mesorhizobium sp. B2-7-3 TaxID=2589907 RepID=UPI0011291CFC|nr:hypothetical protein [Mesorhizobium sp. B2-7-3]TPJ13721.1 hypothetical protein FJW04_19090 [Mesorhizobium sp. B2-7-3]